ncbi:hypothetical protein GLOTRDRAFT_113825 [Gloeophyllum trabeum ATCC 11539]|uniref:BTB domain-containing protein n=1 Tax=Gloeophyllum trabeum (strain ATCC 11539 / FP-39264 / Madison 617) TaxID=670483 RepID=S7QIE3_GLOTA|nr:uncharacterized protein GLOTRDRAFT_113825 [Gloeophyllum trabeum ATCC 11539]EPQ58982.1 hypothetical protein GLOTRDRAFT_113825 [Gloeophyllum trabeum ATCC 11539]
MESGDWENVMQYVSEPLETDILPHGEPKPVSELVAPLSAQVPTPPDSQTATPSSEDPAESTIVSVSTTFFPGASVDPLPPDLVLLSSDTVFFYVHTHRLLTASENGFHSLLPVTPQQPSNDVGPVLTVPEPSAVLNVLLHTIYHMSCAHYAPPFSVLEAAVAAMQTYGVPLRAHIAPTLPLYQHLLLHAPLLPIALYALAAQHDLYELAVATSAHLLSFALPSLTDDLARRIGPVYLKRLFFLHLGRVDALKRLLLPPPQPHGPTAWCDAVEQKKLTRAWALAAAYLAWDARPDVSTATIESALNPLGEQLTCDLCRLALKERIKSLTIQWSVVKRTI